MGWYRKQPTVVEAHQVGVEIVGDILRWILAGGATAQLVVHAGSHTGIEVHTLEGVMTANPGDWIIKDIAGEFYPCRDDIFQQTYSEVAGPT